MFLSWPTSKTGEKRHWETLVPVQDDSWRSIAITIMEVYTSRTHGSYIEETEMKVLWQYRDADPEFGYLQSRELEDHLSNVLQSFDVDILHGGVEEGGYVEVRPRGVNKGVVGMHIVKQIPSRYTAHKKVDFASIRAKTLPIATAADSRRQTSSTAAQTIFVDAVATLIALIPDGHLIFDDLKNAQNSQAAKHAARDEAARTARRARLR